MASHVEKQGQGPENMASHVEKKGNDLNYPTLELLMWKNKGKDLKI